MSFSIAQLFSLEGRVALVTGASGALGGRFAETLALAGARVVLAARRLEPMQALCERLAGGSGRHMTVHMDVAEKASVDAAIDEAAAELGMIDIAVNNSGIALTASALDEPDEEWDRLMRVNLDGARTVALAVARRLVDAKKPGSIINVASVTGLRQAGAVTAYATSKAALIQMTKQHALEWARHGIRVNAIAPGYIETDLNRDFFATDAGRALIKRIPQRRLGHTEDLDGALLLLASNAGAYMTGTVVSVDGGHLVSSL